MFAILLLSGDIPEGRRLTRLTSLDLICCNKTFTLTRFKHFLFVRRQKKMISIKRRKINNISKVPKAVLPCITQFLTFEEIVCVWKRVSKRWKDVLKLNYCCINLKIPMSVTDDKLVILQRWSKLTSLDLGCCDNITDAGLGYLNRLVCLTSLDLRSCDNITDVGLGYLSGNTPEGSGNIPEGSRLTRLTSLDLSWCDKITDVGLDHLSRLTTLVISYKAQGR